MMVKSESDNGREAGARLFEIAIWPELENAGTPLGNGRRREIAEEQVAVVMDDRRWTDPCGAPRRYVRHTVDLAGG